MSDRQIFWKVIMLPLVRGLPQGRFWHLQGQSEKYGATSMLAGNILGKTRTISVAIAAETAAGNYGTARFLGCHYPYAVLRDRSCY